MTVSRRFQAVIFDLDGTLLDTLRDIAEAMNAVLGKLGYPTHPVGEYKRLTGDGVVALIENSFPAGASDPESVRRAADLLREEYLLTWDRHTRPYPGIPELLDGLTRLGAPMNILSNKMDEFTVKAAETFLAKWTFENVLGVR